MRMPLAARPFALIPVVGIALSALGILVVAARGLDVTVATWALAGLIAGFSLSGSV
jgi:hypothetical protein